MLALVLLFACADDGRGGPDPEDSAANGGSCDPSVPSIELPSFAGFALEEPTLRIATAAYDTEALLAPDVQHEIWLPAAETPPRDELVVFLPGTKNYPSAFRNVARIAASAGYPVIVLAWESQQVPASYCVDVATYEALETCTVAVMDEKAYGVDPTDGSDSYDIGYADAIEGRLVRLLQHLHAEFPDVGADKYLDGDAPAWSSIVLGGFSQGSVLAGYLAGQHEVARAVLLAGGCDLIESLEDDSVWLAEWCSAPRATPAERTWALTHLEDNATDKMMFYESFGLLDLGEPIDAGAASPAYCADARVYTFALTAMDGGEEVEGGRQHLSTAHDDFMPVDAEGVPELAEDYFYMFTAD